MNSVASKISKLLTPVTDKEWQDHKTCRSVARINFGEVQDPQNVDLMDPTLWTQKVDFLNLTDLLTLWQKKWPALWQKVDLLEDLGWWVAPLYSSGYGLEDMS